MDLRLIDRHCAQCGARLRPDETDCHVCQQASSDPGVRQLAERVETEGAAAITGTLGTGGCPNLAYATLLLLYIGAADDAVGEAAAATLQQTTNQDVLRELVTMLGSQRWLGHPIGARFFEAEHGGRSISGVVRSLFQQQSDFHRGVLLECLRSGDFRTREAAADLLQYHRGPDVAEALAQALKSDRDPTVRARAAFALGMQGDTSAVDLLVRALHDESTLVQSKAAQSLAQLGSRIVPEAARSLAIGSPEAALQSARVLSEVGSPEAIQALLDAMIDRRDLVRLYAEQALVQMGEPVIVPLLEALIRRGDAVGLREGAAYVLRTMRLPDRQRAIVAPVVAAHNRMDAGVEMPAAAYEALGKLQGLTPEQLKARLATI